MRSELARVEYFAVPPNAALQISLNRFLHDEVWRGVFVFGKRTQAVAICNVQLAGQICSHRFFRGLTNFSCNFRMFYEKEVRHTTPRQIQVLQQQHLLDVQALQQEVN